MSQLHAHVPPTTFASPREAQLDWRLHGAHVGYATYPGLHALHVAPLNPALHVHTHLPPTALGLPFGEQ